MYEREEHYSKVALDGTTETRIIKERYGSGLGEFCVAITCITFGVMTVTLVTAIVHQPKTENPSNYPGTDQILEGNYVNNQEIPLQVALNPKPALRSEVRQRKRSRIDSTLLTLRQSRRSHTAFRRKHKVLSLFRR